MSAADKDDINLNKQSNRTYVSPRFQEQPSGASTRTASKVLDSTTDFSFDMENGRLVLRESSGGRHVVEVRFFEADRRISGITIQKYSTGTGRAHRSASLSFWGEQIPRPVEFLLNIKRLRFPTSDKINISDAALRQIILSDEQMNDLAVGDQEALIALARGKITKRDVIALAYRKEQLEEFRRLLGDEQYFESRRVADGEKSREQVWQRFFEANQWVFGYGLAMVSLAALKGRRLQQIVAGASLSSPGKTPDALMKTKGAVNSLCFVEIKHHRTELLSRSSQPYRSAAWAPSGELVGGVAQSHATVHAALQMIRERLDVTFGGDPTGEQLYGYDPRSYLVAGSLAEFKTTNGTNEEKYRSFEYFRRSLRRPEIITFDELYERAALIVAEQDE